MTSLLWLHKGMLINVHLHMIAQNVEKSVDLTWDKTYIYTSKASEALPQTGLEESQIGIMKLTFLTENGLNHSNSA